MTDGPDPNRSSQPTSPTKSLKSERNGKLFIAFLLSYEKKNGQSSKKKHMMDT